MSVFDTKRTPYLHYSFPLAGDDRCLYVGVKNGVVKFNTFVAFPLDVPVPMDTIEEMVRAVYKGDCLPAVLADAVEERLSLADEVEGAQWLLRMLRGDPDWRDAVPRRRDR